MHFELAAACEVFGVDRSDIADPWYEFAVCGRPGAQVGGRFRLEPDHGFERLALADTVIVPAWADLDAAPPAELLEAVRAAHRAGCPGGLALHRGVRAGRRRAPGRPHGPPPTGCTPRSWLPGTPGCGSTPTCSTSTRAASSPRPTRPRRWTSACISSGSTTAPPSPTRSPASWSCRPTGRAARRSSSPPRCRTRRGAHPLAELLSWALRRLDRPITVEDLARQANMSSRNLARHFRATTGTTPLRWLLAQRIHRAQELLETTQDSVEAIAAATGMGTATTLRRHFNRALGVPPDAYRRTFRSERPHAGHRLRRRSPWQAPQFRAAPARRPGVRPPRRRGPGHPPCQVRDAKWYRPIARWRHAPYPRLAQDLHGNPTARGPRSALPLAGAAHRSTHLTPPHR